jgi:hypothetical protein
MWLWKSVSGFDRLSACSFPQEDLRCSRGSEYSHCRPGAELRDFEKQKSQGDIRGHHVASEPRRRGADCQLLGVRSDEKVLEVALGPGVAIQLLLYRAPTASTIGTLCRRKRHAGDGRQLDVLRAGLTCAMAHQKVCRFSDETFESFCYPMRCGRGRTPRRNFARYRVCSSRVENITLGLNPVSQSRAPGPPVLVAASVSA